MTEIIAIIRKALLEHGKKHNEASKTRRKAPKMPQDAREPQTHADVPPEPVRGFYGILSGFAGKIINRQVTCPTCGDEYVVCTRGPYPATSCYKCIDRWNEYQKAMVVKNA